MSRKYPRTLAEAIKEIKALEACVTASHNAEHNQRAEIDRLQRESREFQHAAAEENKKLAAREKETRAQFDDLKTRVHNLEIENARMHGYLARAREDDEVREELLQVGDPDGEAHLVPKRKPRLQTDYTPSPGFDTVNIDAGTYRSRYEERPRKHWVNY